jgi:hypothetical protein
LAKKVKSNSVIEDSEEEWEEWEGIQDKGDWPKESGKMMETEEVRVSLASEAEIQEETEEDKSKEKREARKEVRRSERNARRDEKRKLLKDLVYLVRELGSKVYQFADEVRVSNVLRNRADREYLEERRRWYFTDRMGNAKDSGEDSERYSV